MNPLLISGFGTSINVDRRKLIVTNKLKNQRLEFSPHKIDHDSIIIDGHTGNITFESMRWLMKHNIHLTLLNWDGKLLAATLPEAPLSGKLRIKQYQKYQDNTIRFKIAEKIVQSKIQSSLNLLSELAKFYDFGYAKAEKSIQNERQLFAKSEPSLNNLMTYEGRVAQAYFDSLGTIFAKTGTKFSFLQRLGKENRRNYNASDEINVLLNYGYSILEAEIRKCTNAIGLDYSIGFLHEVHQGRTPLVYDLQELLRWLVDYSVIQLLEEGSLQKSDFIVTESYHMRLRESGAKLLIEKIRINFNRKSPYKDKNSTYQNILYDNVQQLANFIADKIKRVEFVVPKMEINRDDTVLLRQKLLSMTPEQRKKLGINKSTLWYIKKNIQSKDKIKIYDKVLDKVRSFEQQSS
ncbi:MAG: CRISPR-associated endonuclease Cas1 [Thaumarchaeota archaeon]|nr:CRISPR-associated endonuclease Cas1 [Nitrososphaerota archaeon]